MLIDIVTSYSDETKSHLKEIWTQLLQSLAKSEQDKKKILSFLGKCCVLGIDEKKQLVHIGVPSEFAASQVIKFFKKDLLSAVRQMFSDEYQIKTVLYPELQHGGSDLQVNLKSLFDIKEKETLASLPTDGSTGSVLDAKTKASLNSYFGILFEKHLKFANFVVGAHNQLAHSAAVAVAQDPGSAYNPFFIYGDVGLGKTHLMQAIGNSIIEAHPDKVVVYLPTSKFIDQVINAVRFNKLDALKQKLDEVDVLMLDDIQFLAGKEKTQEIFHTIFNDFHSKNKQIVLTSDSPPKELTLLEPRLQSRFSLGLVTDIKAPDMETRIAILETKCKAKATKLDRELIELIAMHVASNVRELEGALNIILTKQKLLQQAVTKEDVLESLQTLGIGIDNPQAEQLKPGAVSVSGIAKPISQLSTFDDIVQYVATFFDIAVNDIRGSSRKKEISQARQLLMYIAKTKFNRSLQKIGDYFGGKNHATVIYAIKTCQATLQDSSHPSNKVIRSLNI